MHKMELHEKISRVLQNGILYLFNLNINSFIVEIVYLDQFGTTAVGFINQSN